MADDKISILECEGFTTQVTFKHASWCEIEVFSGVHSLGNMGGYSWPKFASDLLAVLQRDQGKLLTDIPGARYSNIINDSSAEYLGNVALSGYNTFYFFRSAANRYFFIILADSKGEILLHVKCRLEAVNDWVKKIKGLIIE
ncbi:MAG: hypothetical protein AB2777_21720 [Candidatus Thiodiazotropha endolucinida]